MAGNGAKAWLVPALAAVVALGGIVYALNTQKAAAGKAALEAASAVQDGEPMGAFITGKIRETGTWADSSHVTEWGEPLSEPDVVFDVDVYRAEFEPSVFTVKKGQVVEFRLHGLDNGLADHPDLADALGLEQFSGHGFQIYGPYDVWVTGIRKDVTKTVKFRADEVGEFYIECVVICSPDHYLMRGMFIVEE